MKWFEDKYPNEVYIEYNLLNMKETFYSSNKYRLKTSNPLTKPDSIIN